jgi:hypothetical protein
MKLEVSHSSCSLARSCPKKYHWKYIEGLTPIRKSTALALGTVVHDAWDMFYQGRSEYDVTTHIITTMDEQILNSSLTEQEDLEIIKWTALGMWASFPHKNLLVYQDIRSEKEFKVRLGNMRNVLLVGRSDRLKKREGKWWVGELKTTGLPLQQFKNKMGVSDQVTDYVYAWQQKGYPVHGVEFDIVKKPLLRKGVNETCDGFCQRIYTDYLSNPQKYHLKHFEYRSAEDIARWIVDACATVRTIRRIWRGHVYRNPDACWNYNAECPYKKICFTDKPDQLTVDLYFEKKVRKQ